MDIKEIPVELREGRGSSDAGRLRRRGRIPAILYGLARDPAALSVDGDSFRKLFDAGFRVFDLKLGEKEQLCLLKDVQFDPVGERVIHVDFSRVDETSSVTVTVALNYIGQPESVAHAFIEYPQQDIDVTCQPRDIPAHVDVNLSGMEVGSHIEASQLTLPPGVQLTSSPTDVVVTYHYKHAGMEEAEPGEGEEEATEPEVLTEKKPEAEE